MVLTYNELTVAEQQMLLAVAEQNARKGLVDGEWCEPHAEWYPCELRSIQACFASLRSADQLLGSIGTTEPRHPLVIDVARNAFDVASLVAQRRRVAEADFYHLVLDINVLSPLLFIAEASFKGVASQLQPGRDGVFIWGRDRSATFLPTMWEQYMNSTEFLRQLCSRADIDSESWPAGVRVATFTTQCFSRTLDETPRKPLPR